jgi:hypothetical protein
MKIEKKKLEKKKLEMQREKFREGVEATISRLTQKEFNDLVHSIFNAVCVDVNKGLNGEEDTIFFDAIHKLFEETHKCYFSTKYDGNETPWDPEKVPLCVLCAKKAHNMITYYGGRPGRIIAN